MISFIMPSTGAAFVYSIARILTEQFGITVDIVQPNIPVRESTKLIVVLSDTLVPPNLSSAYIGKSGLPAVTLASDPSNIDYWIEYWMFNVNREYIDSSIKRLYVGNVAAIALHFAGVEMEPIPISSVGTGENYKFKNKELADNIIINEDDKYYRHIDGKKFYSLKMMKYYNAKPNNLINMILEIYDESDDRGENPKVQEPEDPIGGLAKELSTIEVPGLDIFGSD